MKDIILKTNDKGKWIPNSKVIGINNENLQGNIVFEFADTFVDGIGYLEVKKPDETIGYIQMAKVNESYVLPIKSSLINIQGILEIQLRVTQAEADSEIPVYKSNIVELNVKEAINSTTEIPDDYPTWIDTANAKLLEIDNLDIDAIKTGSVATITITKKDGTTEEVEINDGETGEDGQPGRDGAIQYTAGEGIEITEDNVINATGGSAEWGAITGTLTDQTDLNNALGNKADKETGKGLSTNDYTTEEKDKLRGIEAGAEANVNADWNSVSGDSQILNKPSVPTKTSDLLNDSNFQNSTQISSSINTHNTSDLSHNDIRTLANEAKTIAQGRAISITFDTTADLIAWISNVNNKNVLRVGDNLYDATSGVPDYWIKEVLDTPNSSGYYYDIRQLDAEIPDISNMATTDTAQTISGNKNFTGNIKHNGNDLIDTTDSRLSDSRQASDVYSWAKQSTKPTYTANEVGALPSNTTIPTKTSDLTNDSDFQTTTQVNDIVDNSRYYNYLDNSDFTLPVNQRLVSGTISNLGYFLDRWKLTSGTVTINAYNITLNGTIEQTLEFNLGSSFTCQVDGGATANYNDTTKKFTITGANKTISYAGLYKNSVAPKYMSKGYATELQNCMRFYMRFPVNTRVRAYNCTATVLDFIYPIPVAMRGVPDFNFSFEVFNSQSVKQTGFTFEKLVFPPFYVGVRAKKSSHGLEDGWINTNEIIEISSDL